MANVGELLKTKREEKGLSLADVHEATKIAPQTIAALEENRFDAFPNKVYTRAFIRDYANFLGLDGAALADSYESEAEVPAVEKPEVRRGRGGFRRAFAAACVLVVLCAGGYTVYRYYENLGVSQPVKPKPKIHMNAKPQPKSEPIASPKPKAVDTSQQNPTKPTEEVVPPGQVKVELTAKTQPVWIWVKRNGKTELMKTLAVGETYTTVGKRIWVRAGAAYALGYKVNGKDMGMFGKPKQSGVNRTFP